jgi:hypothetical protein
MEMSLLDIMDPIGATPIGEVVSPDLVHKIGTTLFTITSGRVGKMLLLPVEVVVSAPHMADEYSLYSIWPARSHATSQVLPSAEVERAICPANAEYPNWTGLSQDVPFQFT